ncbi:MAG: ABC transporter permease [Bacteroidales bacterium]|nr:ABC transporter permease [Bacteroidales bacterium]HPD95477.1 ABC transporter permease [Tenuifilaceae bacterium]HRX31359.1 ABC transporter permease [Tenuifilaceae bacterium]
MKKRLAILNEIFRISINSILSSKLRSILTILIIALGIMALVGILTAIESIENSISSGFSQMGANSFTIQSRGMRVNVNGKRYRTKNYSYISMQQAREFKEKFKFPADVSILVWATGASTIKHESNKTNPNINVRGIDENYVKTAGVEVAKGRNFSNYDLSNGISAAIIGDEVARKLFPNNENPLDKFISVGNGRYRVIGVLKKKGSGFGGGPDRSVFLPYTNVAVYFSRPSMNYSVTVQPHDPKLLEAAVSEAEGIFRLVRGLNAIDESDFNIEKSDNLAKLLIENLKYVSFAATFIGLITLIGAAVGLMNIMLVAVTERTREIGTRKAIGAKSSFIKQQFLSEAILICLIGGILGVMFGILIGNVVSMLTSSPFIIPWGWMFGGLLISFIVGMTSGYIPAVKASRLDPIEALRYE